MIKEQMMNYKLLKDIDPKWSFSKLSLDARRQYTDLSTPCQPSNQSGGTASKKIRKKLMLHLGLTKELIKGMHTCHLCACDSMNGNCQNVAHVYFGSSQENRFDALYGHYAHDAKPAYLPAGPINEPYCPDCGYTSVAKENRKRRASVKRHIKLKRCNSPFGPKRKTHPSFCAAKEKDNKGYL
jgi:hypothetical protein